MSLDGSAITKAAKVNKDGVHCQLCHHIEMARRYAEARGLSLMDAILTLSR